jgi:hypothetical protein
MLRPATVNIKRRMAQQRCRRDRKILRQSCNRSLISVVPEAESDEEPD